MTVQPSVMRNVRVFGRVEIADGEGSIENCRFEPRLRERRPRWMPDSVARRLRTLVTELDYPLVTIPLKGEE